MAVESRILKGKCKLCGKLFLMELRRDGKEFKVSNMEEAQPEQYAAYSSNVKQEVYYASNNLQKDLGDGRRLVAGYSYPRTGYPCRPNSPYHFHCLYCNQLEFDYAKTKNPYGKWAGVSNIPDADVDEYGNALGSSYDLAEDGAFRGYRVLILNFAILTRGDAKLDKVTAELQKKGFEVIELRKNASLDENLKNYLKKDQKAAKTQVWVLSSSTEILSSSSFSLLRSFYNAGHGLYLLGDDEPSFAEANRFLSYFGRARMEGDYPGKKLLTVTANIENPGIIKDHLVTTGIVNFFEGKTVAGIRITPSSGLKPLIRGSNGEILACYYDQDGKRMIADGGYTRLYAGWEQAGNERYFSNVAAYLANIERFGYDPE